MVVNHKNELTPLQKGNNEKYRKVLVMKKYLSVFLIIIAFNFMLVVSAAIPSDVVGTNLETDYVEQQKTNWCWAATAENAIIWEGSPTRDQADAVRYIKGTLLNPYPNEGGSLNDMRNAAEYISKNTEEYTAVATVKNFSFISEQIYNEHPVLAAAGYYNAGVRTGGHATLIVGWDISTGAQRITYFDSIDGKYHTCSYAAFCNGSFNDRIYDGTCYHS